MLTIEQHVSLAQHSTMRLGGEASYLAEVHTRDELKEAVLWAQEKQLPMIMIGGGSNIIWRDEGFPGLVMVNRILGYDEYVSLDSHFITVGAGEIWDTVVGRSVAAGLTGIEALSLIPGTAGATPVQNVGAYGQDISQVITSIEVFDKTTGQLTTVPPEACGFAYRQSKFQTEYRDRFFITAITLHLTASAPAPPFYSAVEKYLSEHPVDGAVTSRHIRDAVIAIREAKLPDPSVVANCGSFFGNPILDDRRYYELREEHPAMPGWQGDDGRVKIPAAWLVEQVGYKDVHDSKRGMATWPTQPLVLVNERATSTADLIAFRDEITAAVQARFGITLHQEPVLLP
ncbi:UDP-N-acetylenolpyruvoylglucosamine reductase [Candidatus Saccharibacteria bacterium]|nr:MAG: UDP-N-acetylenolpyruvoylglucosamine reductase [Candidatus Saccharibacteria bacterium]